MNAKQNLAIDQAYALLAAALHVAYIEDCTTFPDMGLTFQDWLLAQQTEVAVRIANAYAH